MLVVVLGVVIRCHIVRKQRRNALPVTEVEARPPHAEELLSEPQAGEEAGDDEETYLTPVSSNSAPSPDHHITSEYITSSSAAAPLQVRSIARIWFGFWE